MIIVPEKQSFYIGDIVLEDNGYFTPVSINKSYRNEPVNLDYVVYPFKSELVIRTGRTDKGKTIKLPQLVFVTATKDNNVAWTFENEEERDQYYDKFMADYVEVLKIGE